MSETLHYFNDIYFESILDIKPHNIMIVDRKVPINDLEFVLIDFGLTYSMNDSFYHRCFAGSPGYVC